MKELRGTNSILRAWNQLAKPEARDTILPCSGSHAWATHMAELRPIASPQALFHVADEVWRALSETDWQEAFNSHPRLGERKAITASEQSLRWSTGEQSSLSADLALAHELAEANAAYEARFQRIFLLCATGKRTDEVLASLKSRLGNDNATELLVAVEEQRRITQLRLRKWLELPQRGCDGV